MKKVILIALMSIGVAAIGQEAGRKHDARAMKDLTPEQMATLQTKRMTLDLDLTQTQQQQIQALNLEQAKVRKSKMEARAAKKEGEAAEKPTSEAVYAMRNTELDREIAHKAAMKKVLSQEQYEKWEKMGHKKGMHHRGHKGKEGGEKHRGQRK
ncbi:MAG: hypothetical protein WBN18_03910 [Flavobacteriaceae bacterium]